MLNSIRDLFNLFDEDHSGQLNLKELALLHQEVTGKKVKENINQLKNDIDADGSGEISIEEYAQWLLNGKVPLAQTSIKNSTNVFRAYNDFVKPKLDAIPQNINYDKKDTRHCKVRFNMGAGNQKYSGADPGLSIGFRVGLSDGKDKEVNDRRKQLGFQIVPASHFSLKIEVDTSRSSMTEIVSEIENSALIRFLSRYCEEYNKRNCTDDQKDEGASVRIKDEVIYKADKSLESESVIIGLQGGIMSDIYQSGLIGVEPMLTQLIAIQKDYSADVMEKFS